MNEQILAVPKDGEYYPVALRHDLLEEVPSLRERFPDYASYAGRTIEQVFSGGELEGIAGLSATMLASVLIRNTGEGMLVEELPVRAQLAPMYGIHLEDLTGDGRKEILMGGNLYDVKPQSGPYDASRGAVLSWRDNRIQSYMPQQSGVNITGEIRRFQIIESNSNRYLLIVKFDADISILQLNVSSGNYR